MASGFQPSVRAHAPPRSRRPWFVTRGHSWARGHAARRCTTPPASRVWRCVPGSRPRAGLGTRLAWGARPRNPRMKELMLPLMMSAALGVAGCDEPVRATSGGEQAEVQRGLEADPDQQAQTETRTTKAEPSTIAPPTPTPRPSPTPPPSPSPQPDPTPPPSPTPPPNPSPRPDPTPMPIPTPPPSPSPDPTPPPNPSPSPTPPPTPLR
jgi:outer membrane biosynthesis protein TonB